ncbi:DEAD/DEAH box helicase [Ectothiorhodospiraceae bacterium BW-2]|nr:DEAD/DEAH box helicase [Ectothiorhodospiraceae bacterium BW-2]
MQNTQPTFSDLGLSEAVLQSLQQIGYESPSPIQAAIIPHLLAGRDVIGVAQTGTGKTAAFALPLLSQLSGHSQQPQLLILTPTRELALQVAEACQRYASARQDIHIAAIYGGEEYRVQLRQLKRGVDIVVGTPGRILDHLRRGSLKLDQLAHLVLDEADEMLRMGFIDDVETILEQTPTERQIALFSATMPAPIGRIAARYLRQPEEITIKSQTRTATTITQKYRVVAAHHKTEVLTRILEGREYEGVIIFVRTKNSTTELNEKLLARGYSASALNGDMDQSIRQRTVDQFKKGKIDILVATDVAARGLDVERVTLVVNYDIPYDAESYVHRIGRTGRAGREGEAILFVTPREKRMLRTIERSTRQPIELMELPSAAEINRLRLDRFTQTLLAAMEDPRLERYRGIVHQLEAEYDIAFDDMAAVLAMLQQGDALLSVKELPASDFGEANERRGGEHASAPPQGDRGKKGRDSKRQKRHSGTLANKLYRLEIGSQDQVKPGNIVGAIANVAGLESRHIGNIEIYSDHSTVELPDGMPEEIFGDLYNCRICGKPMKLKPLS